MFPEPFASRIRHGETGQLVDFFDPAALAKLGAQARAFAVAHCDLGARCLPGQMAWVERLADNRAA